MTLQRPACGTHQGYRAHLRRDEDACLPCRTANAERVRNERQVAKPRQLKPKGNRGPKPVTTCPSLGSWERHRQAGERCEVCTAYRSGYDAATHRASVLIGSLKADVRRLRESLSWHGRVAS